MENSQRIIKFRAWDKENEKMYDLEFCIGFDISDFKKPRPRHTSLEIMQYTGLKDKNGKEIYEGDIVKINPSKRWEKKDHESMTGIRTVVWNTEEASFAYDRHIPMSWGGFGDIEIIGNIYENPELIK